MTTHRRQPEPADFQLTDELIRDEIAKDVAFSRIYDMGRLTPGIIFAVSVAAAAMLAACLMRDGLRLSVTITGLASALIMGRVLDRVLRKRLNHSAQYVAYCRALAQYRMSASEDHAEARPADEEWFSRLDVYCGQQIGAAVCSASGQIIWASAALCEWTGRHSAVGARLEDLMPSEEGIVLAADDVEVERQLIAADGQVAQAFAYGSTIRDEAGDAAYKIAVIRRRNSIINEGSPEQRKAMAALVAGHIVRSYAAACAVSAAASMKASKAVAKAA